MVTTAEHSGSPGTPAGLPIQLTRFIGRDRELDDLVRLVETTRLLTLTGAGGSGKTRLALEAAHRLAGSFTRIAWADLAPFTESGLLAIPVAAAVRAQERAGRPPIEWIVEAVGADRVLLVIDNCEHMVGECAGLAEALLRACPRLSVVATSREALGVASETAWLVPPLSRNEAVQLFVERAQATLPSFTLSPANDAAVEEICRRLDGIPLAIELAAARVRVLSVEQIAARLDDAFRLLTTGSRTALPRHRTLRATMEWSHGLLDEREQVLLRRLAVFAGSFDLDAAEAVCVRDPLDADDILDGMTALVDKSLVLMEPGDSEARYRLLETVRQYGQERLEAAGELDAVHVLHARHYLTIIEEAEPHLIGGSNRPGLVSMLRVEFDNLRAACAWAVSHPEHAELAVRYVGALFWFWYAIGQFREARQLVDRALALDRTDVNPAHTARALVSSALTALAQGDWSLSREHFEAALPLLRAQGDMVGTAAALAKYSAAHVLGGDVDRGIAMLEETFAMTRDWPEHDISVIFARFWRGWAASARGDFELARELIHVNARVGAEHGLPTTHAHALVTLAAIEMARGDVGRAAELVAEGIEREVELQDGWGTALGLDVVAPLAAHRGHDETAARLLGGVAGHRQRLAMALPELVPAERDALIGRLRTSLGDRFDALYDEGLAMSSADVLTLARSELASKPATAAPRVEVTVSPAPGNGRAPLRVLALGPLEVFVDGRLVQPGEWGSARPRELLVYLLVHPDGRTKEQAGLDFWPDASPEQLRNNFHVTLHRLRKAIGRSSCVGTASNRYRIDPDALDEFDVTEFEREIVAAVRALDRQEEDAASICERALARFRGDFLDGEPVGDWHLSHRDRLQRLFSNALIKLGTHHARDGRHAKAADVYRRLLARDDLNEDAVVALMRSLHALGDRSQALRVYTRFAERLRDEYDAEPGTAAARLLAQLQQGG